MEEVAGKGVRMKEGGEYLAYCMRMVEGFKAGGGRKWCENERWWRVS